MDCIYIAFFVFFCISTTQRATAEMSRQSATCSSETDTLILTQITQPHGVIWDFIFYAVTLWYASRGAGDQTKDIVINGWPAVPPEPQQRSYLYLLLECLLRLHLRPGKERGGGGGGAGLPRSPQLCSGRSSLPQTAVAGVQLPQQPVLLFHPAFLMGTCIKL